MEHLAQPVLNLEAFDDDFFAAYEQQLADISPAEQASAALADILQVKNDDDSGKTYEQLRDETQAFFASDWVRQDEMLMNQATLQFAMACLSHPHGADLAQDSTLSAAFEHGSNLLHAGSGHDHNHNDDHDTDPKTGKKTKKKKRRGWFDLLLK